MNYDVGLVGQFKANWALVKMNESDRKDLDVGVVGSYLDIDLVGSHLDIEVVGSHLDIEIVGRQDELKQSLLLHLDQAQSCQATINSLLVTFDILNRT